MSDFIYELENIVNQWKKQFDVFNGVSIDFTVTEEGQLLVNNLPMLFINDLQLTFARTNISLIEYVFNDGSSLQISFRWPEDEPPVVNAIEYTYFSLDEGNEEDEEV